MPEPIATPTNAAPANRVPITLEFEIEVAGVSRERAMSAGRLLAREAEDMIKVLARAHRVTIVSESEEVVGQ